jgi:hypothetical protein
MGIVWSLGEVGRKRERNETVARGTAASTVPAGLGAVEDFVDGLPLVVRAGDVYVIRRFASNEAEEAEGGHSTKGPI